MGLKVRLVAPLMAVNDVAVASVKYHCAEVMVLLTTEADRGRLKPSPWQMLCEALTASAGFTQGAKMMPKSNVWLVVPGPPVVSLIQGEGMPPTTSTFASLLAMVRPELSVPLSPGVTGETLVRLRPATAVLVPRLVITRP